MEKQILNIFYIGIEEPVCDKKEQVKKASFFARWRKRWAKQKENGKERRGQALQVHEVMRRFPYAEGEIRVFYCLLPEIFLKESENAKKLSQWFLRLDETVRETETRLNGERISFLLTDISLADTFTFADRLPEELFAACFWDVRKKRREKEITISLPEDCGRYSAEQMINILNPYLSRINVVTFVGEECAAGELLEEYLYEEFGIVMIYRKYPLQNTVWIDLGENKSPMHQKYAKENGICHINEAWVRKFLDTAVKNGYNNKVN